MWRRGSFADPNGAADRYIPVLRPYRFLNIPGWGYAPTQNRLRPSRRNTTASWPKGFIALYGIEEIPTL